MRKIIIPLLAMWMLVFTDVSMAAFGGARASAGVSRSYSRPATPSYSRPATSYSTPSYSPSSQPARSSNYSSNSGYSNTSGATYRDNSYRDTAPRQNSAMRDIGVTAAGVAGGVLAASAITSLVSSPNHAGTYTHPQYPGQYFNQQGQPVAAPAPVQAAPQQQYVPQAPQYQQQQPVVVVQQQAPQSSGSFFGFLWSVLWGIIQLAFFLGVVGVLAFGVYKLFLLGKKSDVKTKVREQLELKPSLRDELADLDSKAMDIFYNFQAKSDNEAWVQANTKYLPVKECLSPPSRVLQYEHRTIDCKIEQGKTRASVLYNAVLNEGGSDDFEISQYWNFEKDNGTWKLIGFEFND